MLKAHVGACGPGLRFRGVGMASIKGSSRRPVVKGLRPGKQNRSQSSKRRRRRNLPGAFLGYYEGP